jgi:hypothetical protein
MSVTTSTSIVSGVIETWKKFGVFDFILPFLLVFSIMYGILERVQIFGKEKGAKTHAIIAFTIAMITTLTGWFISFLTGYMPWVSVISIVIITGLMLVAMFYGDIDKLLKKEGAMQYAAIIVTVALAVVLLSLGGPFIEQLRIGDLLTSIGLSVSDLWGLAFFIGFIVVLLIVGKGDKPATPPAK